MTECVKWVNHVEVISHGDYWVNNLMFKYENRSPEPTAVRMLDFQFCRYLHPAIDVAQLIFTCTTKQLRKICLHALLSDYHKTFRYTMRELGTPVRRFEIEDFTKDFHTASQYAFIHACYFLPVALTSPNIINSLISAGKKFSEIRAYIMDTSEDEMLKIRIVQLLDDWLDC